MPPCIPITLSGTLGERHRSLNALVKEASTTPTPFQQIATQKEHSPLDRLFKIDLAGKQKNVEYIMQSLKDDDMLYVSRALKSKWLLDHRDIINPKYLEDTLFPEMIAPAISKFKHWLYINMRDSSLAEEFYEYYKDNNFVYAIKFLRHCSEEVILNEFSKILSKISPHYLQVLSEKCPKVARLFYDSLASNDKVIERYLERPSEYYKSIKSLLKSDPELFFHITEKYYAIGVFNKFNHSSSDYIMREHKSRFMSKPELYAAYVLHLPTVANRLGEDECEDLVIKLARAKFLHVRFEYKFVEPLIKRLPPQKRTAIKKRVFVKKDVGEIIDNWPYEPPVSPNLACDGENAFEDQTFEPISLIPSFIGGVRPMMKKKYAKYLHCEERMMCGMACRAEMGACMMMKTELDRLFDEFRFVGFERAMHELGRRLGAAGSADRRRDIMLVLVSKTGGRAEHVDALLRLSEQHANEPPHARAAVLRGLVRRARAWRLPPAAWRRLRALGRGLGLDGAPPEADCREGLHAVVLRQLLADGEFQPAVYKAFLDSFSTLTEYSLNAQEKIRVAAALQRLLMTSAIDAEPKVAATLFDKFFDVLQAYGIRKVCSASAIVDAIKSLAGRDLEIAKPLLRRLYDMRVERRALLRLNLEFKRDGEALLNALRHEPPALNVTNLVQWLSDNNEKFDQFNDKVTIYFYEKEGIADNLRTVINNKISEKPVLTLARPLASLLGHDFETQLRNLDSAGEEQKRFAAALRSNAHRARPSPDVLAWGWRFAGVKAIATRFFHGSSIEAGTNVLKLAADRRTSRVALQLCKRAPSTIPETFTIVSPKRPSAALRGALLHMRSNGAASEKVWNIIKPLILKIDLSSRKRLQDLLCNVDWIPIHLRPDHCAILYVAFEKVSNSNTDDILQNLMKLLPKVNPDWVDNVLLRMLQIKIDLNDENTSNEDILMPEILYPALFVRYMLLSPTEDEQRRRLEQIGQPFLDRLNRMRKIDSGKFMYVDFEEDVLRQTLESLKYNEACLNTKYVSCLPVIEKIKEWMQTFLPKEENFHQYVNIHLTMLYFKSVRQCMKQMPEVFEDPKRKATEGANIVGYVFGKYIAKEISELVSQYFDSIIELYVGGLTKYLTLYAYCYGTKTKFVSKVIEGILSQSAGMERRLGVYVLNNFRYNLKDSELDELKNIIKTDKQLMMFERSLA